MIKHIKEILYLLKENNRMLKEIISYINYMNSRAESENEHDFVRNVIANIISNPLMGKFK